MSAVQQQDFPKDFSQTAARPLLPKSPVAEAVAGYGATGNPSYAVVDWGQQKVLREQQQQANAEQVVVDFFTGRQSCYMKDPTHHFAMGVRTFLSIASLITMVSVFTLLAREDQKNHSNYTKMVQSALAWHLGPLDLNVAFMFVGASSWASYLTMMTQYFYTDSADAPTWNVSGKSLIAETVAVAAVTGAIVLSKIDPTISFPELNGIFFASNGLKWPLGVATLMKKIHKEGLSNHKLEAAQLFAYTLMLATGIAFLCFNQRFMLEAAPFYNGYVSAACAAFNAVTTMPLLVSLFKKSRSPVQQTPIQRHPPALSEGVQGRKSSSAVIATAMQHEHKPRTAVLRMYNVTTDNPAHASHLVPKLPLEGLSVVTHVSSMPMRNASAESGSSSSDETSNFGSGSRSRSDSNAESSPDNAV